MIKTRFAFAVLFALAVGGNVVGRPREVSTTQSGPAIQVMIGADQLTPLNNGLEVRNGTWVMRITALTPDIIRVRAGRGSLPEDSSWAVLSGSRQHAAQVTQTSGNGVAGFDTKSVKVRVRLATFGVTIVDASDNVIVADPVNWPVEYHGETFRVYKTMPGDEHYFGLGDKMGPLDRRNQAFTLWNTDAYRFQESTDPIYKSIPFFLGVRAGQAYGLLFDNTWRTNLDFGKESRDVYSFGAEGGPLDYYVMAGPDAKAVLGQYIFLTGAAAMPPLWALGFQQSRYSYFPQSKVMEIAKRLRADKIPSDAIYLDIHYQDKNKPFSIDTDRFPEFAKMIADLRHDHLHVVAITDLHIAHQPNHDYVPYDTGKSGDHFVKNPDGSEYVGKVWPGASVFPDFTRTATRAWWGGLYKFLVSTGVAGFWNDMNEPSVFDGPGITMPLDIQHRIDEPGFEARITSHREIHNIVGLENARATYEGLLKLAPDVRPFVLTRASYAGGQRYGATWTGDNSSTWNHMRLSTPMLLNLGLSGFGIAGDDIGGYAGSPSADLLTRWIELGAFNPTYRDHTELGTNDQEVWVSGPEQESIRRRYIEQRYRLLPYIYTAAEELTRTGLPLMRPLFLEFPKANTDGHPLDLDAPGEFLFGRDLLVSPQPYPDTEDNYSTFLPPGEWFDFWTGLRVPTASANADLKDASTRVRVLIEKPALSRLPIYVREGAIIPVQPLVQSTEDTPQGPLELHIYPGKNCAGSVYWDDGNSFAYRHGEFFREQFSCEQAGGVVRVRLDQREGQLRPWWNQVQLVVYGWTSARSVVRVNGSASLSAGTFDSERQTLRVLLEGRQLPVNVEIRTH